VVAPGHEEARFVTGVKVSHREIVVPASILLLAPELSETQGNGTYTRGTNVSGPPISSTSVAMECGAKKLYSQDEA
jgi:hypothetical protein